MSKILNTTFPAIIWIKKITYDHKKKSKRKGTIKRRAKNIYWMLPTIHLQISEEIKLNTFSREIGCYMLET